MSVGVYEGVRFGTHERASAFDGVYQNTSNWHKVQASNMQPD